MGGSGLNLAMILIPILVPGLIALIKMLIPKIPSVALPIIAPMLGAAIDVGTAYATGTNANPILSAFLGSAGTGVREIYDQVRQIPAGTSLTPSKPGPGNRLIYPS